MSLGIANVGASLDFALSYFSKGYVVRDYLCMFLNVAKTIVVVRERHLWV